MDEQQSSDDKLVVKPIWSDADFDELGWHDATLHALGYAHALGAEPWLGRLLMDIDYIVHWIGPQPGRQYLSFDVAPAKLVFYEAADIQCTLSFPVL
ncbi:MAG TPA: hypothetical protein VGO93_12610 [Candidatus Xenobia bacterium]